MPCYHPIDAYHYPNAGRVRFSRPQDGRLWKAVTVPCNHCIGCRTDRLQDWTNRAVLESQMHHDNCFITLTYDDEHLPLGYSLNPDDLVKFFKRLRSWIAANVPGNPKIKFRACGEYGDTTFRPHYHVLLHGWMPPDLQQWHQDPKTGHWTFTSEILDNIWKNGGTKTGSITAESAAYVNGYINKKFKTDDQSDYDITDPRTGKTYKRHPEFQRTSIGYARSYYEKYKSDIYPADNIVIAGKQVSVPRYFDRLLGEEDPAELERLKEQRKKRFYESEVALRTEERRETIEQCKKLNLKNKKGGKL